MFILRVQLRGWANLGGGGYHYVVDDQLASGELSWFVTPRASDAKVFEDVAAAWVFIKRLRISGPLEILDLADELLAREAG